MPSVDAGAQKERAGRAAAARVRPGARIALGTGSTASAAIRAIAGRVAPGDGTEFVASSEASAALARSLGLAVRDPAPGDRYELMIDGADEVAPNLDLLKGGGGALFREKLLARHSASLVIAVDASKLVRHLGERTPVPVEIVPFARPLLLDRFTASGWAPRLRTGADGDPYRTDNGGEILDLHLPAPLETPAELDRALRATTGVVETGLFLGLADRVLVGRPDGSVEERRRTA